MEHLTEKNKSNTILLNETRSENEYVQQGGETIYEGTDKIKKEMPTEKRNE